MALATLATLAVERRIQAALAELDCPASVFAAISDVTGTKLTLAFNGSRPLTNEEGRRLEAVVNEMRELAQEHAPVPVSFRNASLIKPILEERRAAGKTTQEAAQ
jgi:hypothetical protein